MSDTIDISIPLRFDGPQPNHFGAPAAATTPLVADGFTGAVATGGSCECATLTLTPHCNGTHTETVRHVTGEGPAPHEVLDAMTLVAALVTVTPVRGAECDESADPPFDPDDLLVTCAALERVLGSDTEALIVRTAPNDDGKRTADWTTRPAPFFTTEAMAWVVGRGVRHLLFDGPSLDRIHDEGKLTAHRIFFGLAPADPGRALTSVTEMVFVPDTVADGPYELNLQVPAFDTDAAPSRPLIRPRRRA